MNQTFHKYFGIYFIRLLWNWNKEIIILPSGMVLFSICKDFLQRKIIYNKGQTKHVSFKTEIWEPPFNKHIWCVTFVGQYNNVAVGGIKTFCDRIKYLWKYPFRENRLSFHASHEIVRSYQCPTWHLKWTCAFPKKKSRRVLENDIWFQYITDVVVTKLWE